MFDICNLINSSVWLFCNSILDFENVFAVVDFPHHLGPWIQIAPEISNISLIFWSQIFLIYLLNVFLYIDKLENVAKNIEKCRK
ncbi:hypothetical protein LQ356_00825 [Metamycoplasma faucium]|uniref:Uncharacterized protein n=1 Tax=Metamycoplasma faucium TaxID=56142 RepID=A0ABZ2TM30_9BACT